MLLLAACEDGRLTLAVTDAPVDEATAVVVEFTGVEVKPADEDAKRFDFSPRSVDLLALSGNASETLLAEAEVPGGDYEWIRLIVSAAADGVDDSYIDLASGERHELAIPSGAEGGLTLASGFTVPERESRGFTIDFDLRKSIHAPADAADPYELRPVLRMVEDARAGAIAGTVDATLRPAGCGPAVYVYSGTGVTPDDVDGAGVEPVTTALVSNAGAYRAGFLAEGPYTVAFTCQAADDDPGTSETLEFSQTQSVDVAAGQTTTVNFGP